MTHASPEKKPFLYDLTEIRKRAQEHIQRGAVTEHYPKEREAILGLLNEALATELLCSLRYRYHYFAATGIHSEAIKKEFLEHSQDELEHADMLAERIVQLDGNPNMNPEGMAARSASQYTEGTTLLEMIEEDLVAERIAIETYREIIRFLALRDPTSRRIFEKILAKEEEHAEDLATLLTSVHSTEEGNTQGWVSKGP